MPAVVVLHELLVCPVCQGNLGPEADTLRCEGCARIYPQPDGVPDLTPVPPPDDAVLARWGLWEELQRNGAEEYAADPVASLSVGDREEPAAFARFSALSGRVLDVGCGPQALPSYAASFDGVLVGVDPLPGERPRQFHFVQAIAEYLPFPAGSFDRVLFATSLDHVLSPQLALTEARRVTKEDGAVLVWLGEIVQPPSVPDRLQTAARLLRAGDLRGVGARIAAMTRHGLNRRKDVQAEPVAPRRAVPEGAVDAFHFAHPDEASVREWLRHAGLTVTESERPFSNSCFLRSVPAV